MGAAHWIDHDIEMVMTHYPTGGAKTVLKHLRKKHSLNAIQGKAKRLGVKKGNTYERKELNQALLTAIKKAYASGKRGALKELSEREGVDYQWLKHLASTYGIAHSKNYRWGPQADQIIQDNEGLSPQSIRNRLKEAGYHYPVAAIAKRMSNLKITLQADDEYNIQHLTEIFGINHRRVTGLIERGLLKTRKHHTTRGTESEKRYITTAHLRQFIKQNPSEFDLRKIDPAFHVWFIDLLTNRTAEKAGE